MSALAFAVQALALWARLSNYLFCYCDDVLARAVVGFSVWYWIIKDALPAFKAAVEAGEMTGFKHSGLRVHAG